MLIINKVDTADPDRNKTVRQNIALHNPKAKVIETTCRVSATSLLDAGESAGQLMPSGCRMGVCFGCVIPLKEGSVRDLRNKGGHHRRARRRREDPDLHLRGRRPSATSTSDPLETRTRSKE